MNWQNIYSHKHVNIIVNNVIFKNINITHVVVKNAGINSQ